MHNEKNTNFKTTPLDPDYIAPDSSEIRTLCSSSRCSVDHMTFGPQLISHAGIHKTVEEKWYVLEGKGQIWLKNKYFEEVIDLHPGVIVQVIPGTKLQFRNDGVNPLKCLLICSPPWPGPQEWSPVKGYWDNFK